MIRLLFPYVIYNLKVIIIFQFKQENDVSL